MDAGPRSPHRPHRIWSVPTAARIIASALTIVLLLVVVSHHDADVPRTTDCPSPAVVNAALATHVAAPTAVSENDLLGCFYQQGSDGQAVSVSFATPALVDPCRQRPRLRVAGDEACNVTGTPGTNKTGASLEVETAERQDQFSTDLRSVSLDRLEALAVKVLAGPSPPLYSGSS